MCSLTVKHITQHCNWRVTWFHCINAFWTRKTKTKEGRTTHGVCGKVGGGEGKGGGRQDSFSP